MLQRKCTLSRLTEGQYTLFELGIVFMAQIVNNITLLSNVKEKDDIVMHRVAKRK